MMISEYYGNINQWRDDDDDDGDDADDADDDDDGDDGDDADDDEEDEEEEDDIRKREREGEISKNIGKNTGLNYPFDVDGKQHKWDWTRKNSGKLGYILDIFDGYVIYGT